MDVKILKYSHPTLSPTGSQFADKLDALNSNYYLSKGVVGQSHLPLLFTRGDGIDFEPKPDINIGYKKSQRTVNMLIAQNPYSRLSYGSSLNNDYQVSVSHSQNVAPRWNVAFDYTLINPEGVYAHSSSTNHYLDFTTNYYSRDSRYQVQGGVIWQHFTMEENGGLAADSVFTMRLQSNRAGIPVTYEDLVSKDKELIIFAHQSFNTVRQLPRYEYHTEVVMLDSIADSTTTVDTIPAPRPKVLNSGVFGFDIAVESDTLHYGRRQLWQHYSSLLYWTNDAYMNYRWPNPLKITIGAKPEHFKSHIDSIGTDEFASISPFAKAELNITNRFSLIFSGEKRFASNKNMNALRLAIETAFEMDSIRRVAASVALQQAPAELIFHQHAAIMSLPLALMKVNKYELGYTRDSVLDLRLTARNVANNVWIESNGITTQSTANAWLLQAKMKMTLKWHHWHYDMQQILQYSTDEEQIRVPLWATKNSIYADVDLFAKALKVQIGLDVRYHTAYYADAYQPYGGYFYRQNETKIGNYIWGDVFINLQVKRATIYAKVGHLNAVWETSPNYFLLPHYPGQKLGLIYGVVWRFFD